MSDQIIPKNLRILVVDDTRAIHDAFRKILTSTQPEREELEKLEASLFHQPVVRPTRLCFQVDSAYQGEEGMAMVQSAYQNGKPYAVAFVDVRMPPGCDGIETAARLWQIDPELEIIICTAYSDYSWEEMITKLGHSDRLVVLKKPFETVEVLQLATCLTEKWRLSQQARLTVNHLERLVQERTLQLRKLSRAVEQSPASIVITDTRGVIEYVNPKFCALTGYAFDEIVGQNPRILKSGEMSLEHYCQLWAAICAGREWRGEFHNKKKNGELYWEFASISAVKDESGRVTHFVAVKEDITERKKFEAERDLMIKSLEETLAKVNTLSGLIPICAGCKRIRDDKGYWSQVEIYVSEHSEARFSHGLCPECAHKYYPDVEYREGE